MFKSTFSIYIMSLYLTISEIKQDRLCDFRAKTSKGTVLDYISHIFFTLEVNEHYGFSFVLLVISNALK